MTRAPTPKRSKAKKPPASRNPKNGSDAEVRERGAVHRPRQPRDVTDVRLLDATGPKRYYLTWDGSRRVVEKWAEAVSRKERYSYVHPLLYVDESKADTKLDHWVKNSALEPIPVSQRVAGSQTYRRLVRRVDHIVFGNLVVPAWYESGYSHQLDPQLRENGGRLYVCPSCLKYTPSKERYAEHEKSQACGGDKFTRGMAHPPGCEIYRSEGWSVWEVDGGYSEPPTADGAEGERLGWEDASVMTCPVHTQAIAEEESLARGRYCESLMLLTRLFLDNKLNRFGPMPFKFYVLTELVAGRHCFRGMFSREKGHTAHNLSCIVVLPPWQRSGWGKRLVHLSYLLSRIEGHTGMPEKPLSRLGRRVYETYHDGQILDFLRANAGHLEGKAKKDAVETIALATGIEVSDTQESLVRLTLATGLTNGTIDWKAIFDPLLNASASRPELEFREGCLFHASYDEMKMQPLVEL